MKGRMIAMRTEYLAAIAIVVLAASAALAMNSQSTPVATQVADRLAVSADPFLVRSSG